MHWAVSLPHVSLWSNTNCFCSSIFRSLRLCRLLEKARERNEGEKRHAKSACLCRGHTVGTCICTGKFSPGRLVRRFENGPRGSCLSRGAKHEDDQRARGDAHLDTHD